MQDADTKDVLMVAWMNEESFHKTLETKETWFWSRSRQEPMAQRAVRVAMCNMW